MSETSASDIPTEQKDTKREGIKPKDLITIGIFTAIMILVYFISSMVAFVPLLTPLLCVVAPIIGGIPFMLFATKTKKFGMVTIMGVLIGIIYALMSTAVWLVVTSPIFALLADLIMRSGNYASSKKDILGYGVYSIACIGTFIPVIFTRDAYVARLLETGYTLEYAQAVLNVIPDWSLILLLIACFVSGIIGGLLGRAMLKKHFVRAGIA